MSWDLEWALSWQVPGDPRFPAESLPAATPAAHAVGRAPSASLLHAPTVPPAGPGHEHFRDAPRPDHPPHDGHSPASRERSSSLQGMDMASLPPRKRPWHDGPGTSEHRDMDAPSEDRGSKGKGRRGGMGPWEGSSAHCVWPHPRAWEGAVQAAPSRIANSALHPDPGDELPLLASPPLVLRAPGCSVLLCSALTRSRHHELMFLGAANYKQKL